MIPSLSLVCPLQFLVEVSTNCTSDLPGKKVDNKLVSLSFNIKPDKLHVRGKHFDELYL